MDPADRSRLPRRPRPLGPARVFGRASRGLLVGGARTLLPVQRRSGQWLAGAHGPSRTVGSLGVDATARLIPRRDVQTAARSRQQKRPATRRRWPRARGRRRFVSRGEGGPNLLHYPVRTGSRWTGCRARPPRFPSTIPLRPSPPARNGFEALREFFPMAALLAHSIKHPPEPQWRVVERCFLLHPLAYLVSGGLRGGSNGP